MGHPKFGTRLLPKFLPPFAILSAVLLYFYGPLFSHQVLLYRDLFFFHYPLRYYWISLLHEGHPPFLNAALNGGQPLLANPNYSVFYPGNALYLLLPFNLAWNLSLIFHVAWAATGMYFLARSLRSSRAASLAASILFAFSGPFLSALDYYNLMVAMSWMPWTILLFRNALQRRGRYILLPAFTVAAQILAGEPTVVLFTLFLLIAISIHFLRRSEKKTRDTMIMLCIPLLSVGLAAVQMIPTLLWLPNSGRSEGLDFFSSAAYWSLHPARLLEFFVPNFFGNVMSSETKNFWGMSFSDSGYPYIFRLYCGWLPLLLVPFAMKRENGRAGFAVFLCGVILAFGRFLPGYHFLFTIFPPMHVIRYPEKFLLLVPFGLALIAGAAITNLSRQSEKRIQPLIVSALLFFVIAGVAFFSRGLAVENEPQRLLQSAAMQQSLLWGAMSLLLIALTVFRKTSFTIAMLPILLLIDLAAVTRDVPQVWSEKEVDTKPYLIVRFPEVAEQPVLHATENQLDDYYEGGIDPQFYLKEALHPLTGLKWGIQYGATNDIDRMSWKVSSARQQWIQAHFPRPEAIEEMRMCGIARVISLAVIKNPQLPIDRLLKLKEGKHVWVYHVSPDPFPRVRWEQGSGGLEWQEPAPDHFRIRSNASSAGVLLIARNAIPGWKRTIDGSPGEADQSPQGWIRIAVPPGKHNIELWYRPPGLLAGTFVTALTSLVVLGLFLIG